MKRESKEAAFKQLAQTYVLQYGLELKQQAKQIEATSPSPTPALDQRVYQAIQAKKKSHARGWIYLVAAALILICLLPQLLPLIRQRSGAPADKSNFPAMNTESSKGAIQGSETDSFDILPLAFNLPEYLEVTDSKLDNGKSVYHLSSQRQDDIVLTMEKLAPPAPNPNLYQYMVLDTEVEGIYTADYSLLQFEHQGIWYVLTCRHDIDSLLDLTEQILV